MRWKSVGEKQWWFLHILFIFRLQCNSQLYLRRLLDFRLMRSLRHISSPRYFPSNAIVRNSLFLTVPLCFVNFTVRDWFERTVKIIRKTVTYVCVKLFTYLFDFCYNVLIRIGTILRYDTVLWSYIMKCFVIGNVFLFYGYYIRVAVRKLEWNIYLQCVFITCDNISVIVL